MFIDYPFHLEPSGRTATTDDDDHIRDLIEQVLFTTPGERVNRPTFGSGLLRLVFSPNSTELAATAQLLVQASLQEWLGDLIQVDGVAVTSPAESTIQVSVAYRVGRDQARQVAQFTRKV
jgi:phage baseplate assembly protein W